MGYPAIPMPHQYIFIPLEAPPSQRDSIYSGFRMYDYVRQLAIQDHPTPRHIYGTDVQPQFSII